MGSELGLDSDRGRGACFWFDLEAPALVEETDGAEDSKATAASMARPSDAWLAPALEMLELGQVLGIERWARATAAADPAYAPFLDQVVAHCIAVDLEALARLFASHISKDAAPPHPEPPLAVR